MSNSIYDGLNQLGGSGKAANRPEDAVLEYVANPRPQSDQNHFHGCQKRHGLFPQRDISRVWDKAVCGRAGD